MSIKREQILTAVKTRMETIRTAAGYLTDIGEAVMLRQYVPLDDDQTLSLVIKPLPSPTGVAAAGKHGHTLSVGLIILVDKDEDLTVSNQVAADVLKAIGTDVKWGSLADRTELTEVSEEIEVSGRILPALTLAVTIHYKAPLWTL